jgi:glycosyltransferase involved in cell wall biosynthesis
MQMGHILMRKKTMPDVSLLIPTYNNAQTVESTLISCLNQTYDSIEVVVYDEASKDGTRDIVGRVAAKDDRVRFLWSDVNTGAVRAWSRLLHEAEGRYSSLVFSDDLLMPDFTSTLIRSLEEDDKRLVSGCSAFCETTPSVMNSVDPLEAQPDRRRVYPFDSIDLSGPAYALGILLGLFPVTPTCSLFRTAPARNIIETCIQFPNPFGFDFERRAYGNDLALISELGLYSSSVFQHGVPLVVLRDSPNSLTVNALKSHRHDFWLQYTWAAYAVWNRCSGVDPAMSRLKRIVKDRVHLTDTMASLFVRRMPHYFNPLRILRALLFMMTMDKRVRHSVTPNDLVRYIQNL